MASNPVSPGPGLPLATHSARTSLRVQPRTADVGSMALAASTLTPALIRQLPAGRPVVCDPGACSGLGSALAEHHRLILPPQEAAIGYAIPTAIGVALAENRERAGAGGSNVAPVVVLADPQALLMTGPELTTAAREKLPLLIIVPVSSAVNGSADHVPSQPFLFGARIDLAEFARSFGFPFLTADGGDTRAAEKTIAEAMTHMVAACASCVIVEWRALQQHLSPQPAERSLSPIASPSAEWRALVPRMCAELQEAGVGLIVGSPASQELLDLMHAIRGEVSRLNETTALQVIVATDGQSSGFIADGFARRNREGGPIGAILIEGTAPPASFSGVGEALMDCTPMLVLVLEPEGLESDSIAMDVAAKLCTESFDMATPGALRLAAAAARGGCPAPVAVLVRRSVSTLADVSHQTTPTLPAVDVALQSAVASVVDAVRNAKQPRLHLGLGAAKATPLVVELAERTGAIVSTTFSGKGVFPEDHPRWLWPGVGPAIPPPLRTLDKACDVWVILGARMGELASAHYNWPSRRVTVFHVDIEPGVPGANVRGAVPIVADVAAFVRELLRALESIGHAPATSVQEELAACVCRAHAALATTVADEEAAVRGAADTWVSPSVLFRRLQACMPDATFTTDSGNGTTYGSESLRVRGARYMGPVNYSSMGFAVPAALGAALALVRQTRVSDSNRIAVATVGDGAWRMTGLELASAVRARLPVIVVVLTDGELGMMSGLQRAAGQQPFCTVLNGFDACALARSVGAPARRVTSEAELSDAVEWAQRHATTSGPVLLDVAVCYAYPSFYARGIAGAQPPGRGKLPPPPPRMRLTCEHSADLCEVGSSPDIWEILRRAAVTSQQASRVAVRVGGGPEYPIEPTYAQLLRRASSLALALHKLGIRQGKVVGIMTPNCPEAMEAHYAIGGSLRAVVLNVNYRLSAEELAYVFKDSGTELLLADVTFASPLLSAVREANTAGALIQRIVWIGDVPLPEQPLPSDSSEIVIACCAYEDLIAGADPHPHVPTDPVDDDAPDDVSELPCEMYYTSGTSGRPKGVMLSHSAVVTHALGCIDEHRIHTHDVWGHFAPMFHLVDAYAMFSITLVGGTHVFVAGTPAFSAGAVLDSIERWKVSVSNVAGSMISMLLAEQARRVRDLSSLQLLSCGGSPLSKELVVVATRTFGCEFFLSYGMTECCGKISMSLLDQPAVRSLVPLKQLELVCTSGRPFGALDVRLVGKDGITPLIQMGEVGEVQIRGPTVFKGYHNNPEATAEAFTADGWFKTGDLARWEEHGYLTVCDRLKDMILVGGENVYSAEVERVLAAHPQVLLACAYGVPNELLGEVVKAVVVLRENSDNHEPNEALRCLRSFCASHLADYKRPALYEAIALSELPMTGSGKIAKAELRKGDASRRCPTVAAPADNIVLSEGRCGVGGYAQPLLTIEWQSAPLQPLQAASAADMSVLLMAHTSDNLASAVRSALADHRVVMASPLSSPEPTEKEALALRASMTGSSHALFLWPAHASADGTLDVDATEQLLSRLLAASKAVLGARAVRLWVVTRGAMVSAPSEPPIATPNAAPMQALWGFARVLGAEAPDKSSLGGRVIDLCPCETDAEQDARSLLAELRADPEGGSGVISGSESAWRRRARLVPRLVAAQRPPSLDAASRRVARPDASYVITGGLGGLGLQWLPHLTSERWGSARRLVLASRSGKVDKKATEALAMLRKDLNADIICTCADVAVKDDVARLLTTHGAAPKRPLAGIFHLAGVAGDGFISGLSWQHFVEQSAAKIRGSSHLHSFTRGQLLAGGSPLPLDHFVLFTSIYGLLGNPQLSHYAAANSFQDGLAFSRRQEGLAGLALSWGTWAGAGMAHRFGSGFEAYWRSQGMGFIELDDGLLALGELMASASSAHYAYLPADWAAYARARGVRLPQPLTVKLVESACAAPPTGSSVADPEVRPPLVMKLAALAPEARSRAMEREVWGAALVLLELGDEEAASVDFSQPLHEIGLTSIHVISLVTQLSDATGLDLSPTLIYESVSLRALCGTLLEKLDLGEPAADGVTGDANANYAMRASDRLVIAGMACRLPGDANSPEALWSNLLASKDAVIAPPAGRPHNGRESGYLSQEVLMSFDNGLFGVGDREATLMDPQQRLLLHAAYEAFLDAGMPPNELSDRSVGVFVGISQVEYAALAQQAIRDEQIDTSPYLGPAWSLSIAANRISYLLNLTGPSISLDTACSSSLVAVDLAISALREGKCNAALVAGVNVQLLSVWSETFVAAGMLGSSQRCRFGADEADGYVRGEGVGAVLIRRLDDVEPDAVIRLYAEVIGASINQDGKSNGMTAPNPAAQEQMLRAAYKNIDPQQVRYVEAHGTGTRLGDPIELEALGRVLGNAGSKRATHRKEALLVGSVKANIGHLECAAGLASLIKAALIVKTRVVPKTINVAKPNRLVNFDRIGVSLATEGAVLPADGEFYVGLSGLGFGGTNAHVVLKTLSVAADEPHECVSPTATFTRPLALLLSSHSYEHLRTCVVSLAKKLATPAQVDEDEAAAICRSLIALRSHELRLHPFRLAVVGSSVEVHAITPRLTPALITHHVPAM